MTRFPTEGATMGLARSVLRLMVQMHRDSPWVGPVATLGVQDVPASYEELAGLFRAEGVGFRPVAPAQREPSTSHYYQAAGLLAAGYVHPRVFFRMLGLDGYDDIDFMDLERPTL